jgi:hypothetical protein
VLHENPVGSGIYIAEMDAPEEGWTGFLIELTYIYPDIRTLRVTSEVNIVPDIMPFPPCGNHCQSMEPIYTPENLPPLKPVVINN